MPQAKNFFTEEQVRSITAAIVSAEKNTSGEIRVHIENLCTAEPVERAARLFHKLKMDRTELRNGVLFYLAVKDRKFAIVGDKGIHEKVGADFWEDISRAVLEKFSKEQFTEGLCEGIEMAGQKLQQYFPAVKGDKNELGDEVSFNR